MLTILHMLAQHDVQELHIDSAILPCYFLLSFLKIILTAEIPYQIGTKEAEEWAHPRFAV